MHVLREVGESRGSVLCTGMLWTSVHAAGGCMRSGEEYRSERGEKSAHTAPRAPWQQRRDELHGRQILADYACGCARRIYVVADCEGAVRPAAPRGPRSTRVRVCLSLSLSPQRSALSHITPLIIYQTHQRKTHNGNATRDDAAHATHGTRARAHALTGAISMSGHGGRA